MPVESHILPYHDEVEHEMSEDCVCGPKKVEFDTPNRAVMYRHHPLKRGMVVYYVEEVAR